MTEERKLPAEGVRPMTVIAIEDGGVTSARKIPYLTLKLRDMDGSEHRSLLFGFFSTLGMIQAARPFFVGKQVQVKIKHQPFGETTYYQVDPRWETLTDA